MKILALEFSSSQRSVAVVQANRGLGPAFESEIIEAGGRSSKAFGMIERALAEARVTREEIDCLAVGLGPGSYTGVRAAIAVAQGWQLARSVQLLGICTIEVLAAQAQADGLRGEVWIAVDAQRGDYYLAGWRIGEFDRFEHDPLKIVSRQTVEDLLSSGGVVCGPDLARVLPRLRMLYPSALKLGRLLRESDYFVPGHQLKPVYLRETTFVKVPAPRQM